MKLLICSPVFAPSVGGLETINLLLARELVRVGWQVVLVTPTMVSESDSYQFRVVRNPSFRELMDLYKWCDVFMHNAIVLKYAFPAMLLKKPFVVVHHSCSYNWNQSNNYQSAIKRIISRFANNIVVSEAVAANLNLRPGYHVINNFYDSSLFKITNTSTRRDFVYVGRLSFEKGLPLLIEAFRKYAADGGVMNLSIVGDGYQKKELKQLVETYGLSGRITFEGVKKGVALRELLNNKRTLVLPSICKEAFGIVILEAMACGCYCIGSDGDGISEAMGGYGMLFKKSDADSLAAAMKNEDNRVDTDYEEYCCRISRYLDSFSLNSISRKWTEYLEQLISK